MSCETIKSSTLCFISSQSDRLIVEVTLSHCLLSSDHIKLTNWGKQIWEIIGIQIRAVLNKSYCKCPNIPHHQKIQYTRHTPKHAGGAERCRHANGQQYFVSWLIACVFLCIFDWYWIQIHVVLSRSLLLEGYCGRNAAGSQLWSWTSVVVLVMIACKTT
jgi:hypothetical protein